MDVDVVVIGAGLAGLVTARDLIRSGLDVAVLEARTRVGGRVLNRVLSDGTVVEIGGQWVGPTQDRLESLAAELGVATFPTFDDGENVLVVRGRQRRYRGAIPRLPRHVLADLGQAQLRLDRMARHVPLEAPWSAPRAKTWDGQTVDTWIRRRMRTRQGRDMFRLGVASVFAAEAAELSLLDFLFTSHSGGLLDRLFNVAGGAQERRFVGGSQVLAEALATRVGESVRLGCPVRGIRHDSESVTAHADGGVLVRARRGVVSIPPALAARVIYDPPLPAGRDQLTQRTPMGSVIKVMAAYDEPFWRADGLTGQATSDRGPVRLTFDNSPPSGSPGVLLGFMEGDEARQAGRWTEGRRRQAVLECFARAFGPRAGAAREYVEMDWSDEEWTRGCYGAHLPPGTWTQFGPALREPCGRLHWAGTETATVWAGYMDGAVRSGERVAAEVAAALRDQG
ncbi:MAG: flavin monoamine oxidase family protein [Actinobacteria bacterium]|nr:MAG: flavin monoamine oxidase family protein [Actinomycetota bacterium]